MNSDKNSGLTVDPELKMSMQADKGRNSEIVSLDRAQTNKAEIFERQAKSMIRNSIMNSLNKLKYRKV